MAVFRVERTRDYTVMSNHHLKNKDLSLKAKGSAVADALAAGELGLYACRTFRPSTSESKDAIRSAVNELEKAGYIRRRQTVDSRGKFSGNEYIIYEQPQPSSASPSSVFPTTGNPSTEKPSSENPTQLKIDQVNIQEENTQGSNTHSILSCTPDVKRSEMNRNEIEQYRALIEENIDYDILLEEMPYEQERLEEIVGLMTDTVCSSRSHIRVAGSDFPAEVVKSRLLKLNAEHIRFVFDCLKKNTTEIRNIRQYLLTALYNAPVSINSHYAAQVNHDLYG